MFAVVDWLAGFVPACNERHLYFSVIRAEQVSMCRQNVRNLQIV